MTKFELAPKVDSPLFFIGSSPSLASKIINSDFPADGAMISANALRKRKSDFIVGSLLSPQNWILDSGAFTEITRYGRYRHSVEEYHQQILRWHSCKHLLIAVSQDYMCEPFALSRTGLSIEVHQRLTIERYEQLLSLSPPVPIMPVLQGWRVSDYIEHLLAYSYRLQLGQWVGIGSICKRNNKPDEVADILKAIKLLRPDLRLHGFGLKLLALQHPEVKKLLYSSDSMAYSYSRKFGDRTPELQLAHQYQAKVATAVSDSARKEPTSTSGAGNNQGRKPKWKSPTKALRVPEKYLEKLVALAYSWENAEGP